MGLQTWPQSKLPLSSMACLDVEPPTICRVLQRRLQQRRTREQLVEQGIMPPLKIPVAFHEQIRSLERARTGNFLKHKLCSRPVRSELVRMHILQETQAEPSLQATQMKLKRARLADDLNDKISHRPGPMELVVKNILPVDNSVKEVILEGKVNSPNTVDVYTFEEDSRDAIPPERPTRQAPQHSCSASPKEAAGSEAVSPSPPLNSATQSSPIPQATSNSTNIAPKQQSSHLAKVPQTITTVTPTARGPFLVKQSQPKAPGDKSRSKKSKEPKPRVKKLKYHQYVPPDQKEEASEVPMDSAYARLLQQQQQFLQLQILSQQQQRYNYQAILPAPLCQGNNIHNSCSNVVPSRSGLSTMDSLTNVAPARPSQTVTNHTLAHLPANLEEMKVAELKLELKQRGLLVSGTKTDLIERLKSHGETSSIQPASTMDVAQTEKGLKLSPPVSPIVSKVFSLGLGEESATADGEASALTPPGVSQEGSGAESGASEKDKRLREKECQIEELKRKLQQEQSLVEELKMQLEVEKRSQQEGSSPRHSPPAPIQVKEENGGFSSCSASRGQAVIKQEEAVDQKSPSQQLFVGHPGPPILLDGSVSESAVTIHLPHNGVKFQATVSCVTPCLVQATGALPKKTAETAVALEQHYALSRPMTEQTAPLRTFPVSVCQLRTNACEAMEDTPQHLNSILQSGGPAMASGSEDAVTRPKQKSLCQAKDPPRYEDAVKQSRSMQIVSQVPTATSQHMDDLFDVLIESGEILPFIRQDPSCLDKLCPVTANVTSLPVNTALSRPPPHIQVARPPAPSLKATDVVPPATASHHLETLLEGTRRREPHEIPTTPTDGMELDPNTVFPFPFHLHSTHLDNMDWLDHTIPVAEEAASPLDVSFSADLLDSHVLQLHWA